jgi:hypothetical protein
MVFNQGVGGDHETTIGCTDYRRIVAGAHKCVLRNVETSDGSL